MNLHFPLLIDERGQTTSSDEPMHIRELIEQVLFTRPGERVGRPTFGCNLLGLVFGPSAQSLGAAARQMVMGALDQWLGEFIAVASVEVESQDATLYIKVSYVVRATGASQVSQFTQQL